MTGLNEFEKLFGDITVLNVIELVLAAVFLLFVYKRVKDYLVKRYEANRAKDQQLKEALEVVSNYPNYRKQSLKIQEDLNSKIAELGGRLEEIEEERRRSERNKLRDMIIRSHRYYTDKARNPQQIWNRMEADAFWELVRDYEDYNGDGYVHSKIIPEMEALTIIEMDDLERLATPVLPQQIYRAKE